MKLKTRRTTTKPGQPQAVRVEQISQWLLCQTCNFEEVEVGPDISAVICARCVQKLVPAPEEKKPVIRLHTGFARGWHLKKRYIAPDGNIYERGKQVEASTVTNAEPTITRTSKRGTAKRADTKPVKRKYKARNRHP